MVLNVISMITTTAGCFALGALIGYRRGRIRGYRAGRIATYDSWGTGVCRACHEKHGDEANIKDLHHEG